MRGHKPCIFNFRSKKKCDGTRLAYFLIFASFSSFTRHLYQTTTNIIYKLYFNWQGITIIYNHLRDIIQIEGHTLEMGTFEIPK